MVPHVTWGLKTVYHTLPPNDVCLSHSCYFPSTAYRHLHLRDLLDVGDHVCLPSCVPHAGTVLTKHGVGVEPLFCLFFWDRGRACARGGGRGTIPPNKTRQGGGCKLSLGMAKYHFSTFQRKTAKSALLGLSTKVAKSLRRSQDRILRSPDEWTPGQRSRFGGLGMRPCTYHLHPQIARTVCTQVPQPSLVFLTVLPPHHPISMSESTLCHST